MELEAKLEGLIEHLELIKCDLRWQLSFEEINWDHFGEFVRSAKTIKNQIEKLKLKLDLMVEAV